MLNFLTRILLDRGNDLSTYFLPMAYFFKHSLINLHQIPLWNTFQFLGQPYLADPQNFIFYLPNYLFLFLPIKLAFIILIFTHLLLAGIGTYLLARKNFTFSRLISFSVAIFFALTPKMFSHLEGGHYSMVIAFSWLPWFVLTALKLIDKPNFKHCSLLAVVSWFIYINYINIAYFAILFFGLYLIYSFVITPTIRHNKTRYLLFAIFYLLLFLGLIAPNLLAQLEIAPLSTRSLMTFTYVAQPIWSFKLFLQNLLFPYRLTYLQFTTERILFPGILVGTLALVSFFSWKNTTRWFFGGWIFFSLLYSLGARIPFFIFFYKFFPLIKWMRITTRLWIISNLLIAVLAGFGLTRIWHRFNHKLTYLIICLSWLELLLIHYKIFDQPTQPEIAPASFYQTLRSDQSYFRTYCTTACLSLRKLGELNVNSISANNPVQILSFVDYLQSAGGYQYWRYAPILPPYPSYDQQPQPNGEMLGKMNVKYVASPYPLTDLSFELLQNESGFYLYQNLAQKPLWLAQDGTVEISYFSPNIIKLKVASLTDDNLLTLSNQFYPGWKAVDQNNHLLPVINVAPFMATKVAKDTTEITFSYAPHYLKISLIAFGTAWTAIIYAYFHPQLLFRSRRARRRGLR